MRRIAFLADGLSTHLDAVSVVHQAVEDAVGDSGIADLRTLCAFLLGRIGNSFNDPQVRDAQHDMLTVYTQSLKRLRDVQQHPEPDTPYGQRPGSADRSGYGGTGRRIKTPDFYDYPGYLDLWQVLVRLRDCVYT